MLGIDREIVQNSCMSGSMEPVKNYTKSQMQKHLDQWRALTQVRPSL